MNLLDFVFRLGVLFAIYGFLWGLIEIGLFILSGGRKRSLSEVYLIRVIKYFLLVDVTFLFCLDDSTSQMIVINQVIFAGIVLLTYFIGKLQQNQNKSMVFKYFGSGFQPNKPTFDIRIESLVIILSILLFIGFWFKPDLAFNPVSNWFHKSILNIEETPVFGFIFQIIGFFFLLSMILKMIAAFTFILNGGSFARDRAGDQNDQRDDHFDDYEEIN